ncbi:hypothetical protein [Dysgonomonas sp. GY75]|uniref:hypothetical protein n=1 Tax=Dysgonomonas sp. GY75 TaxID=2780419 RepID=UPI001F55084D|nr:hypothetical protein [Dysgonomonas sp. GY75]
MNKDDIQKMIEEASNEHKDETDYIASQEYICGCSNENDKLFCWEASTACSIQARESFKAGANFILHENRWRKFGTDELPNLGMTILLKSGNRYDTTVIHSHQHIHELSEKYVEWKPIT